MHPARPRTAPAQAGQKHGTDGPPGTRNDEPSPVRAPPESVPAATSWYLADLGQALGRQELFTKQSPQKLKALREHALIESAVSSNRIEGVTVDQKRVGTVVFGKALLRDRDEEEVRGYRKALDLIHTEGAGLAVSEATVRRLIRCRAAASATRANTSSATTTSSRSIRTAGAKSGSERFEPTTRPPRWKNWSGTGKRSSSNGRSNPPSPWPRSTSTSCASTRSATATAACPGCSCYSSPITWAWKSGATSAWSVSSSRTKNATTRRSSSARHGWHKGKHNPWHYVNYVLYTLLDAYKELERRVGDVKAPRGEKRALVLAAVNQARDTFTLADLQRVCPGVGVDMIRKTLKELRTSGEIVCVRRGRNSLWRRSKKAN